MLCVGTQTVFIDNANEPHDMILFKHFTERNHAAVVDIKTRKRKTGNHRLILTLRDFRSESWERFPSKLFPVSQLRTINSSSLRIPHHPAWQDQLRARFLQNLCSSLTWVISQLLLATCCRPVRTVALLMLWKPPGSCPWPWKDSTTHSRYWLKPELKCKSQLSVLFYFSVWS